MREGKKRNKENKGKVLLKLTIKLIHLETKENFDFYSLSFFRRILNRIRLGTENLYRVAIQIA